MTDADAIAARLLEDEDYRRRVAAWLAAVPAPDGFRQDYGGGDDADPWVTPAEVVKMFEDEGVVVRLDTVQRWCKNGWALGADDIRHPNGTRWLIRASGARRRRGGR